MFLMCVVVLLVLATAVEASAPVPEEHRAGSALNPLDYDSLGQFPAAPGSYLFNTSGVPTLIGPWMRIEGIVLDSVAVFTFDDIWVPPDMFLHCDGPRPLALLSHRSVAVEGLIRAGTCRSDAWAEEGSLGRGENSPSPWGGGGGGGFGGAGAHGNESDYGSGGRGGSPYGDIRVALQGGSRGGAGANIAGWPVLVGGWGGGALELGAVDTIAIRGPGIYADGGQGGSEEICLADYFYQFGGGGGGSGGGIFVHADSVALETRLSARGGNGGNGCGGGWGGGGGGGRIAVCRRVRELP